MYVYALVKSENQNIVYSDLKQEVRYRLYKMIVQMVLEKYENNLCTYYTFKMTKFYTSILISENEKREF